LGQASRAELSSARPIQPSLPKRWLSPSHQWLGTSPRQNQPHRLRDAESDFQFLLMKLFV